MSTKHTPGPWTNHGRITGPGLPHSAIAAETLIARVFSKYFGDVEQEIANANLIAAAPELLEALAKIVDSAEQRAFEDWLASNSPSGCVEQVQDQWEQSSEFADFCEDWEIERAAVAKARGEA
ncbi:hypothetical protein [Burkholderia cenocepacia]|uniref:hypothetical protein n=1 Tax=Burkholderia cenocepacia TaxID=95486 RepID=UPI0024B82139|nr:hypothetical protein [Burkholderia cenocepacia]MDI9680440.1 hypothetical protein [Burkholderia cenocepacia]